MAKKPPLDPEAVLRGLVDARPGWQRARITFGPPTPSQRGCDGLMDPDGRPWEISFRWQGFLTRAARTVAEHALRQRTAGYDLRVVAVDGETFLLERYGAGGGIRLWDGLIPLEDWRDFSCEGCPWQHDRRVEWFPSGRLTSEVVTLYLRWRSWGVDATNTLWTGQVLRFDAERDGWYAGIRAPASPNLLPTTVPVPAPAPVPAPPAPARSFLADLFLPATDPPPPPRPEGGFREEDEAAAKTALLARAEIWLREHGDHPMAWSRPHPPEGVEHEAAL